MAMEVVDESYNDNGHIVAKGKRTKRQRPLSPLPGPMASSSSTGRGGGGGNNEERSSSMSANTPTNSMEEFVREMSTEEEEDMANCLILLAQGRRDIEINESMSKKRIHDQHVNGHDQIHVVATSAASVGAKADFNGLYAYECKTCNRCFPSFQALGGHRASHKRPKSSTTSTTTNLVFQDQLQGLSESHHFDSCNTNSSSPSSPPPSDPPRQQQHQIHDQITTGHKGGSINNRATKVHECSICGSEFSSGQALGGHMRRHRSTTNTSVTSDPPHQNPSNSKPRNVLALDLNLPAPEDDRDSKLISSFNQRPLVFTASALVDCHY